MPDPSRFEGGGCGSFATAVLEKSGLFGDRKIPDFFRNSLRARSLLFGKGLQNPEETSFPDELLEQQGKISKEKLFLASSWNPFSGESGSPISFIDPEMTILFLKTIYRFSLEDLYRSHRALAERLHQSRIFAFRKIQEQDPLPIGFGNDTEPRSREIPINARFSEQSGLLVKETGSWIAGLFQRGFHARPALIQNGKEGAMAVILDRGYK